MKKLWIAALLFCGFALAAPFASAQENGEDAKKEHGREESPAQGVFKWVNLLLLIGAAGYLLKKPAAEFFESRKRDITSGLERAKAAHEDSTRRMNEIDQRLSRLSIEIESLKSQAHAESAKERERIMAEAQHEMERMVEQSRQEIDRIARGIERDIKGKIADAVIDRAGQSLATQMTEDDQKRVVVRFLNKV
jgi:F-type H+-transporting ATPase subunit b